MQNAQIVKTMIKIKEVKLNETTISLLELKVLFSKIDFHYI